MMGVENGEELQDIASKLWMFYSRTSFGNLSKPFFCCVINTETKRSDLILPSEEIAMPKGRSIGTT
jgi:hypothetical protein